MTFQWILREDLTVDREQALRILGHRAAPAPFLDREDLPSRLRGTALVREVDPGGVDDSWLRRRLAPARYALLSLATVEVPESDDPVRRHFHWAAGSVAVRAMARRVVEFARERWAPDGVSPPWSPGTRGWDLDVGQRTLFTALDGEAVGVRLLPSGAMLPLHSLSLALGIGDYVSAGAAGGCTCPDLCCPVRRPGGAA